MAELSKIARPYAEAAFSYAKEKQQLQQWSDMLKNLGLIAQDKALVSFVTDPTKSRANKAELFVSVMGNKLDDAGKNLLAVMAENDRLLALGETSVLFEELKAVEDKRIKATVISAMETNAEQQSKLSAALNAKYGAEVDITYEVDPSLISGIRIKVGDWVVDNTAVTQINKLGAAIAN